LADHLGLATNWAIEQQFGLFNILSLLIWPNILLSLLFLDLTITRRPSLTMALALAS